MKKVILVFSLFFLSIGVFGCSKGGKVSEISFELMDKTITDIRTEMGYLREIRGFEVLKVNEEDNSMIVYIGAGSKPTTGYSIKVESVQEIDGKISIKVNEVSPSKDQAVGEAITYPMNTIRIQRINSKIEVVNQNGKHLFKINEDKRVEEVIKLARESIDIEEGSNTNISTERFDEEEGYIVHVYEVVTKGKYTHIDTIGWYGVNLEERTVVNLK